MLHLKSARSPPRSFCFDTVVPRLAEYHQEQNAHSPKSLGEILENGLNLPPKERRNKKEPILFGIQIRFDMSCHLAKK
jgi:hypothetical protein